MATFYKPTSTRSLLNKVINIVITHLNHTGVGVGKFQKKAIFVEHTLVGETVKVKITEQSSKFIKAKLLEVLTPSPDRIAPKCRHFQLCGGCDLQHIASDKHLSFKQQKVTELFQRSGFTAKLPWQTALIDKPFHYRRKVRIGVQYNKNDQAIVGFRQKQSNHLISIHTCHVMAEPIADIFPALKQTIDKLSLKRSIGHIEVIHSDKIAVIIRQLVNINSVDKTLWQKVANDNGWHIYLDNGKTITSVDENVDNNETHQLSYRLLDDTEIRFGLDDFIQVNHAINQQMVTQALDWLELSTNDKVLDLFCGLGNFTLPIAKQTANVIGIEGVQTMVNKAQQNAQLNKVHNVSFYQADLNTDWQAAHWFNEAIDELKQINKVVLDPARAGAEIAVQNVAELPLEKILYISCEASSLARDSAILHAQGYQIEKIALMDMFSQTKHIETMVLFVPTK